MGCCSDSTISERSGEHRQYTAAGRAFGDLIHPRCSSRSCRAGHQCNSRLGGLLIGSAQVNHVVKRYKVNQTHTRIVSRLRLICCRPTNTPSAGCYGNISATASKFSWLSCCLGHLFRGGIRRTIVRSMRKVQHRNFASPRRTYQIPA